MRVCPVCNKEMEATWCEECSATTIDPSTVGDARPDPKLGTTIADRYRVESLIGKGGMGKVYRGLQLAMGRPVAIKILRAELSEDLETIKRFHLEARAISILKHPNTIKIIDFGETDAHELYIVLELLEGTVLTDLIKKVERIPWQRAAHIVIQVCKSLDEAHAQKIVHRDLKPGNIFLTKVHGEQDFVKVMDFGIVKLVDREGAEELTKTGIAVGTPHYMSPEQARGKGVDARADIYSLGVIFYRMLTGEVPFKGDTPMDTLMMHLQTPPPAIDRASLEGDVPQDLLDLLYAMLAKRPNSRPASAAIIARALEEILQGEPTPLRLPTVSDDPDDAPTTADTPAVSVDDDVTRAERTPSARSPIATRDPGSDPHEHTTGAIDLRDEPTRAVDVQEAPTSHTPAAAPGEPPRHSVSTGKKALVGVIVLAVLAAGLLIAMAISGKLGDPPPSTSSKGMSPSVGFFVGSAELSIDKIVPPPPVVEEVTAPEVVEEVVEEPKGPPSTIEVAGLTFVRVEGGCFQMGCDYDDPEKCGADELPRHEVCVDTFYMSAYEVTAGQFAPCVDTGYCSPDTFCRAGNNKYCTYGSTDKKDHPMAGVSWEGAVEFTEWLKKQTVGTVRLPTEAEWEYAARSGGDEVPYPWGMSKATGAKVNFCDKQCRYKGWKDKTTDDGWAMTSPVGTYPPNDLGIYDMAGNVWEWCLDVYDPTYYKKSPKQAPKGPLEGLEYVRRGGSWNNDEGNLTVWDRSMDGATEKRHVYGFRPVLILE